MCYVKHMNFLRIVDCTYCWVSRWLVFRLGAVQQFALTCALSRPRPVERRASPCRFTHTARGFKGGVASTTCVPVAPVTTAEAVVALGYVLFDSQLRLVAT